MILLKQKQACLGLWKRRRWTEGLVNFVILHIFITYIAYSLLHIRINGRKLFTMIAASAANNSPRISSIHDAGWNIVNPHARQWCRRWRIENVIWHAEHSLTAWGDLIGATAKPLSSAYAWDAALTALNLSWNQSMLRAKIIKTLPFSCTDLCIAENHKTFPRTLDHECILKIITATVPFHL